MFASIEQFCMSFEVPHPMHAASCLVLLFIVGANRTKLLRIVGGWGETTSQYKESHQPSASHGMCGFPVLKTHAFCK